jgi:hypothetical protein
MYVPERTRVPWFDLPVAGSQNLSLSYRVRYGTQSPPIFVQKCLVNESGSLIFFEEQGEGMSLHRRKMVSA